uniref:CRAL-TRIO domain-containing protein n=1 Tax=Daphnia galeata TaxID=27404 RepID=A0A8J2WLT2_9CRUS|nr:unnamed protein product [Daphnia galeata]
MNVAQLRPVQPIVFDQFSDDAGTKFKTVCVSKANTTVLQLKIALKDCKLPDSSDEYLLKWLKVQDYNVARAENMLRQSLEWRQFNGVDDILNWYVPPEFMSKYFSLGKVGLDRFGCPVYVCCIGRMDFKALLLCITRKQCWNFIAWKFESLTLSLHEARKQTGENIDGYTILMDFEGLALRQYTCKPAMETVIETMKCFLLNYPDHLRRVFALNAPKFFPYLFTILKPFVPQTDIPKIKIFGRDRKQWTSALLEEIDADQLPAFYGGTLTDPDGDPKCPSKFNMGGEVHSSYYLSNNGPVAKDYMKETMSIGAGGKKKFKYKVDVPLSVLRWEFMTEGGDIRFRVYSKNSKGSTNDFVPLSRVDSHLAMEEGYLTCEEPGKYFSLRFFGHGHPNPISASSTNQHFDKRKSSQQQDCNGNVLQTEKKSFIDPKYDQIKAENAIQQLKMAMKDCKLHNPHDEYLYKWLLVNQFDVARAEKMLRQTLEWRRVNGVDNIFQTYTPSEVIRKYDSGGQIGVDKFGCPGIMRSITQKEFTKFTFWTLENYVRATQVETERTGKVVTQSTYIFDYEGFSLSHMSSKPGM